MGYHSHVCEKYCKHKLRRRILLSLLAFVLLVLLVIFIVWLVLRPTKPRFTLQDTTVLQLNLTSSSANEPPFYISTILQPTIASRNPNSRVGIYYDNLDVYAEYKSQQITLADYVTAFYQGAGGVSIWSPVLSGTNVPVSRDVCSSFSQDEMAGIMLVYVKVSGRLRWKVGSWISGRYHIEVNCPAILNLQSVNGSTRIVFQQISSCSVDV